MSGSFLGEFGALRFLVVIWSQNLDENSEIWVPLINVVYYFVLLDYSLYYLGCGCEYYCEMLE